MADRGEGLGRFRPGGRAADDEPPSNLRRTMHASGWMYSSRALVFGWALLLTHQFGIAEYGIYAKSNAGTLTMAGILPAND